MQTYTHDRSRMLSGDLESVLPEFHSPASAGVAARGTISARTEVLDDTVTWSDSDEETKGGDDVFVAHVHAPVVVDRVPFEEQSSATGTPVNASAPNSNLGRLRNVRCFALLSVVVPLVS